MEIFKQILAEGKAAVAKAMGLFNAIQSPPVKIAVACFTALVFFMVLWAVLPWIGLILAVVVVALIVKAFLPAQS